MAARFNVTATKQRDMALPVLTAAAKALQLTAKDIVDEGRRNIAASGRFGPNWQRGLTYRMLDPNPESPKALVFHKSALAEVFETGITIAGKPLLWIPTAARLTTKFPTPRQYVKRTGHKLTAATVHGTPLLFDATDRDPHRKPLYIGVPTVRIPKLWHILEIAKQDVARIREHFARLFQG